MRSPRRLLPLPELTVSPEKEMQLWTRIMNKREAVALKAETARLQMEAERRMRESKMSLASRGTRGNLLPPGLSQAEVDECMKHIKHKWEDKFSTLQRGFLFLDVDRSGKISQEEFKQCVLSFNLDMHIKDGIFDAIFAMVDVNNDGEFSYEEMQKVFVFS